MILFLDFDGVLHPQYEGQAVPEEVSFCHLQKFEAMIRDFPTVEIVISSTWRQQFSLDNLRARFSADIAARITSITPTLIFDSLWTIEQRELEIVAWLEAQGRTSEDWVALDDATWQFKRYRSHVVACSSFVGLDDRSEADLRRALCFYCTSS